MIGPGNIDIEISSPIFFWEGGKGGGFLTTLYKRKQRKKDLIRMHTWLRNIVFSRKRKG